MEVRTTGVPVIGARELRRAADLLRRYKQGKQHLERTDIIITKQRRIAGQRIFPVGEENIMSRV